MAAAALAAAAAFAGGAAPEGPDAGTLTIVSFDGGPDGPGGENYRAGVLRDPAQDPRRQFVSEDVVRLGLPGGGEMGFLRLAYLFDAAPGAFNGFWCRVPADRADWRRYHADGALVVRLRTGQSYPDVVRLEIKVDGGAAVYPCYIRIGPGETREIAERGYADISLPLAEIVGNREALARVSELALVLLHDRLQPSARRGVLLIASIRLVPRAGPEFDGEALLDDLGQRAFAYFRDHRHPETGLVRDRAGNFEGRGTRDARMAAIAATGYYLSILPEAVRLHWMPRDQAEREAVRVLRSAERLEHRHGLFYQFIDWETGERWQGSVVSVLDSAIFLNGVMVAAEAFPSVTEDANRLLDRVDWREFLTEKDGKSLLALGWSPEQSLLGHRDVQPDEAAVVHSLTAGSRTHLLDVRTSEAAMAYFLAIGSRTHPIDPQCWYNTAVSAREVAGYRVLHGELPLFVSTIGLGWADLRGLQDKDGVDLHDNATRAALANRAFCRQVAARRHTTYCECAGGWWGISAGDSAGGYVASGPIYGDANGDVWPMVALATAPWIPREIEGDLGRWRTGRTWPRVLGEYGLAPFNLDTGWIGEDLIGIDLGGGIVSLANARNRTIWDLWMRHPVAQSALRKLQLTAKR